MVVVQARKVAWAATAVVMAYLLLAAASALFDRYRPVSRRRFLIPAGFTGKVYLVHGRPQTWLDAFRGGGPETVNVPVDGLLLVWTVKPSRYDDTYFDVTADGKVEALEDVPAGDLRDLMVHQGERRIAFNAGAELAQCGIDVETFYVGSPAALLHFEEDDRLDRFLRSHPEICPAKP